MGVKRLLSLAIGRSVRGSSAPSALTRHSASTAAALRLPEATRKIDAFGCVLKT
jgi:hypothetical protein